MPSPFESALLNLQLFDLRREPVLREARDWFLREFNPETIDELVTLVSGERNASFRMVLGYWDMAASLVTTGAIDADAFRAAHGEVLATFSKIHPFLAEIRNISDEPEFCSHLEAVVSDTPDAEAILGRRREAARAAVEARLLKRTWPDDWDARTRGDSCPLCGDVSTDSFHSGRISEALLDRKGIAKGHAVVVFRRRHAAALTELTAGELADYWMDVQDVGRVIERVFIPCHMNYMLLGNVVPHLHVHVVPRYLDDPSPEGALAWDPREVPAAEYSRQFQQLQEVAAALGR